MFFFSLNNQQVCGLRFEKFAEENFGWWSCDMKNEGQIFHRGTFKVNKAGSWPTDIRLATDIKVKTKFIKYPLSAFFAPRLHENLAVIVADLKAGNSKVVSNAQRTLQAERSYLV